MQHYKVQKVKAVALESLQSDCCGRRTEASEVDELQEYLRIDFQAGYGSKIFPDEDRVTGDFCQYCVKKLLGDFLTVQEGRTEADRIEAHLLKEGFRPMSEEEISYYKEKGLLGMPEE